MMSYRIPFLLSFLIIATTLNATVADSTLPPTDNEIVVELDEEPAQNEDSWFVWCGKKIVGCFLGKHCIGEGEMTEECGPVGCCCRVVESPREDGSNEDCYCFIFPLSTTKNRGDEKNKACCKGLLCSKKDAPNYSSERCLCGGMLWRCDRDGGEQSEIYCKGLLYSDKRWSQGSSEKCLWRGMLWNCQKEGYNQSCSFCSGILKLGTNNSIISSCKVFWCLSCYKKKE